MKTILLLILSFLGISVAFATPPIIVNTPQCPDAAKLKDTVKNPPFNYVFTVYPPNDPMYQLIENPTTTDIEFFRAYIDNGIMKCSYSSSNRLLVLELQPQLANAVFVNPTLASNSKGITPCPSNYPEQCQFNVKQ